MNLPSSAGTSVPSTTSNAMALNLPLTGGSSTDAILIGGGILLLAAAAAGLIQRRAKPDHNSTNPSQPLPTQQVNQKLPGSRYSRGDPDPGITYASTGRRWVSHGSTGVDARPPERKEMNNKKTLGKRLAALAGVLTIGLAGLAGPASADSGRRDGTPSNASANAIRQVPPVERSTSTTVAPGRSRRWDRDHGHLGSASSVAGAKFTIYKADGVTTKDGAAIDLDTPAD